MFLLTEFLIGVIGWFAVTALFYLFAIIFGLQLAAVGGSRWRVLTIISADLALYCWFISGDTALHTAVVAILPWWAYGVWRTGRRNMRRKALLRKERVA